MYSFTSQYLGSVREKEGHVWLSPAAVRVWAVASSNLGLGLHRWQVRAWISLLSSLLSLVGGFVIFFFEAVGL